MNVAKVTSAIATGVLMLSSFASVASASTVTIAGNGAYSNNSVNLTSNQSTNVSQTNNSTVVTNVNASANTGHNSADLNNGGDVSIVTGNATNDVNVTVGGNTNVANVPACGCDQGNDTIKIKNNSAFSVNKVNLKRNNSLKETQKNWSLVVTGVDTKAKTGGNSASLNNGGVLGGGDPSITTGDAGNTVGVSVDGGTNVLNPSII